MTEDHAYYQLKELIRDGMLEQSPDLAKIMAKYKAITAAKDTEIAALQMQIRVEGAVNGKEIEALKAENERLRSGIQRAKQIIVAEDIHPQSMHFANSVMLALSPLQQTEEKP
jgi:hypothetical protein